MQDLPHHYTVSANGADTGTITLSASNVPDISSAAPAEFGGPGDQWSPESLLVAAVADCFILTFRAIARASKLEWTLLECSAEGTLDRVERVTRFTAVHIAATLTVPEGTDPEKAEKLLTATINATEDLILAVDQNLDVLEFNQPFATKFEHIFRKTPKPGDNLSELMEDFPNERRLSERLWQRAFERDSYVV